MPMNKPQYKPYICGMLAGFGAISLSVLFFFALYRIQTLGEVVDKVQALQRHRLHPGRHRRPCQRSGCLCLRAGRFYRSRG